MMRLWVQSYAQRTTIAPEIVLSAAVHAVIIAAWVVGTLPSADVPPGAIENHAYYVPPPDEVPGRGMTHEVVRYVTVAADGAGAGAGPRVMGNARPVTADETVGLGSRDTVPNAPAALPVASGRLEDSVFTILDVDTAVVRASNSAAPAYPLKLLEAHVMGSVAARYIVDTTGFADTTSFTVLTATHPEFVAAVREALPYMRFQPAKIGSLKVRQLVEQQFSFKINDTSVAAPRTRRP
jgi:hypothetical protein